MFTRDTPSSGHINKLLENLGEAVIATDSNFIINTFNKAAESIYGWSAEELIGKSLSDAIPATYSDTTREVVVAELMQQGRWQGEVMQYAKDGRMLHIMATVVIIKDDDDQTTGFVTVNRDITEKKQLDIAVRESAALWQAFANALPDLAFIFDESGRYIQILATRDDLLYAQKSQLLNNSVHNILPLPVADKFVTTIRTTIATRQPQILEYVLDIRGRTVWFEAHTSFLQLDTDSKPLVVWVARDITQRRRAEHQHIELEGLQITLEKETEMNAIRNRMLSTISHELRTPLSIINLAVEMLERNAEEDSDKPRNSHFKIIREQIEYLTEIVEDVSCTVASMKGELEVNLAPFNLIDACQETIAMLAAEHDNRSIIFHHSAVGEVVADEKHIHLLLTHLLTNAIKFSPADTEIECTVDRTGKNVTLQVSDHGLGIPELEKIHIFDPHYRARNVETIRGIGLGLTIVKTIVELHKGSISVESAEGQGATFTVQLPIVPENLL